MFKLFLGVEGLKCRRLFLIGNFSQICVRAPPTRTLLRILRDILWKINLHKRNRNGCFYRVDIASLQHNDKKYMKKEEIREYLLSRDLRASDVVKRSGGLIGLNQASGWVRKLRRGEDLSNPVLVMLWKIGVERNGLGVYDVQGLKRENLGEVVERLSPKFKKEFNVSLDNRGDNVGMDDVSVYVPGIDEDARFDDIYDKISLLRKDLDEFKVSLVSYLEQK